MNSAIISRILLQKNKFYSSIQGNEDCPIPAIRPFMYSYVEFYLILPWFTPQNGTIARFDTQAAMNAMNGYTRSLATRNFNIS